GKTLAAIFTGETSSECHGANELREPIKSQRKNRRALWRAEGSKHENAPVSANDSIGKRARHGGGSFAEAKMAPSTVET
ncbi:MAG: hypothetical protein KBF88_04630, partial [Polyangiaceae bacterium]|nr:hypothetical protein [Polyangiaceae bacterium]